MSIENPFSSPPQEQAPENPHKKHQTQDVPLDVVQEFSKRVETITGGKAEKPTEERVLEIKAMIEETATIFDEADIRYVLDGALNISLYEDEFFRDHRDVDVSVFSEDIPKLAKILEQKGYALFRFPKDVNEVIKEKGVVRHELLDPEKIDPRNISRERLLFLRVNENLEIDTENYAWFDVHALDTNENGDIVQLNGTILPQSKYTEAVSYTTESGKELRLSHPAILAYHKLKSGREHPDFDDLVVLKKHLSESDFAEIAKWLQQDEEKGWDEDKPKVAKAKEWLEKLKK